MVFCPEHPKRDQFFFRPFGPQFGLKIRGADPPGPSPGSATAFRWSTVGAPLLSWLHTFFYQMFTNIFLLPTYKSLFLYFLNFFPHAFAFFTAKRSLGAEEGTVHKDSSRDFGTTLSSVRKNYNKTIK